MYKLMDTFTIYHLPFTIYNLNVNDNVKYIYALVHRNVQTYGYIYHLPFTI